MMPMIELRPCYADQCDRLVSASSRYCCAGCRVAWESTPRYDVDGYHSPGCDQRHADRAPHRASFGRKP